MILDAVTSYYHTIITGGGRGGGVSQEEVGIDLKRKQNNFTLLFCIIEGVLENPEFSRLGHQRQRKGCHQLFDYLSPKLHGNARIWTEKGTTRSRFTLPRPANASNICLSANPTTISQKIRNRRSLDFLGNT